MNEFKRRCFQGMSVQTQWKYCIEPPSNRIELGLRGLWRYRSLIYLFAKRDFMSRYRQTLLGPLWMILEPFFSTLVFIIVFGNMAKFPTMDSIGSENFVIPAILFYMFSHVLWEFFSLTVKDTARTLIVNAKIMEKVYYPRLTSPFASTLSDLMTLGVMLILYVFLFFVESIYGRVTIRFTFNIFLVPLVILQLALLGLGSGLILSVLTVKYRDIRFMVDFILQVWLYLTPVAYGLLLVPEKWFSLYMLNPVASIITSARYLCFGEGYFNIFFCLWSWIVTLIVFFVGLILFNKTEKNFIDFV